MRSESISREAGCVDFYRLWQGLSFYFSEIGTHWRVLNREKKCSTLFSRRLSLAVILGIVKHRSKESIPGVTEIIPVRDKVWIDIVAMEVVEVFKFWICFKDRTKTNKKVPMVYIRIMRRIKHKNKFCA